MKKNRFTLSMAMLLLLNIALSTFNFLHAVPVSNMPVVRIQPNGDTLHCFLSGDEYYHRLHDASDYLIVQNPRNGYWVYADTVHTERGRWQVVATEYVAGVVDPASVGLNPHLGIDRVDWEECQHRFDVPKQYQESSPKTSGQNHGRLNNIVIFVRFSDDAEISTSFSTINAMFNDSSATSTSMYNYFKKVSYNKIFIPTHYYPTPSSNSVVSYQDSLPRSYYMPYDASTNTNGYQTDNERTSREFGLLERAVNYINANYPVSSSLNLDMDNDGKIDNICFVVKGTYTGWSDLLWPHKWSLYDRYVYINGKRVYTFNLQLEGSGSHYFSSSTFCHEMFHTLGAPDLYRYEVATDVSGVGSWDLMCSNSTPPQHMSAYMKWKYGNWLDSIPEIRLPGTYTLHSLGDDTYDNCCYKIAAQEQHQWYVLEYRDNTELFETALPGRGLLIYRIDDRYSGNADYNGTTIFDEVYLFRPNAPDHTTNGSLSQAYFSGSTSRTAFNPNTNPHPWLTGNVIDTTIGISNVTVPGVTISFTYSDLRGCVEPYDLSQSEITGNGATLSWSGNAPSYQLQWRCVDNPSATQQQIVVQGSSYQLTNLSLNTDYEFRVKAMCSATDISDYSVWHQFRTAICPMPQDDSVGTAEAQYYTVPVNNYYNFTYSQMLFTAAEVGGEKAINKIAFNYHGAIPSSSKDSCIIYMGHTNLSEFSGTAVSNLVPFSQLQKVYVGPLNCEQGWNVFELDSTFYFSGNSNLVVAVDDNSGSYDGSSNYRFNCTATGNLYKSVTYYSDSYNPEPSASSFSGSKSRYKYRPDTRFIGCLPFEPIEYTVTVSSANPLLGSVEGGDTVAENTMVVLTATAAEHCHFLNWVCSNTNAVYYENPISFMATADSNFVAYFAYDSHHLTVNSSNNNMGTAWFSVDSGTEQTDAMVDYGTQVVLHAEPVSHYQFVKWVCNSTGDEYYDNPLTVSVTGDISYTAYFEIENHHITVASSNEVYGMAWFTVSGSDEQLNDSWLNYGTQMLLQAELKESQDANVVYTFEGWNDGFSAMQRYVTLLSDTSFTAMFGTATVGIDDIESQIVVTSFNRTITVRGTEGRRVWLHDMAGRLIAVSAELAEKQFRVLSAGVYLLQIEGLLPRKVVVM